MGSKPKQQDYKASASEKASASAAMAEHKYFKEKYDPLLQKMRDESLTDNTASTLRGRANADTMQALSKNSAQKAIRGDSGSDLAQAYQGQLGVASTSAKNIKNKMQTNVLGTARGQAADSQTGMAQAANLATSQALTRAKANQQVAQAKYSAAAATSSASPPRFKAMEVSALALKASISQALEISVRKGPGMIQLTRTFGP